MSEGCSYCVFTVLPVSAVILYSCKHNLRFILQEVPCIIIHCMGSKRSFFLFSDATCRPCIAWTVTVGQLGTGSC